MNLRMAPVPVLHLRRPADHKLEHKTYCSRYFFNAPLWTRDVGLFRRTDGTKRCLRCQSASAP